MTWVYNLISRSAKQLQKLCSMESLLTATKEANVATVSSLLRPTGLSTRTELVKSDFNRRVELKALPVPAGKLQSCINSLKKLMPGFVKLGSIVEGPDADTKLVLLDPQLFERREQLLSREELVRLTDCGVHLDKPLQHRTVDVAYENYPLAAVLDALLPPDVQLSSFSVVGHIAHFNLRDQLAPYGALIGQVLISKLANIKTVVSKKREISSEYRNFDLQLLAGEPNYVTVHKELGLEFELDFSKVYWNSRLSTEHRRVVNQIQPGDLVFDLCAGVGPFAVPALKLGAAVYANDLNPVAHRYLESNMRRNLRKSQLRSQPDLIRAYNLDARQFVAQVFATRYAQAASEPSSQRRIIAIANLPGMAVDMLDCFVGCVRGHLSDDVPAASAPPVSIFAYSFLRRQSADVKNSREEAEAALINRIRRQLAGGVESASIRLRFVRDVAPSKDMYCAEILCPASVLLLTRSQPRGDADENRSEQAEAEPKRLRLT